MATSEPSGAFDPTFDFKFNSRRSPVMSKHGMVACTQPLAAEIGLSVLKEGGNAVDAAVAVAAALNVTQPCSTGIGGDAFCLYFEKATGKVHGMNASGRCPAALTLEKARAVPGATAEALPFRNVNCITIPGAAAGWCDSVEKWGSWDMGRILAPAIALAKEGFPVSPITAHAWKHGEPLLRLGPHAEELLLPDGSPPSAGEVFCNPTLAATFEAVASEGRDGFYKGRIADAIVEVVASLGGCISHEDLASHSNTFPDPISVNYHGVQVFEIPPNGQGITALIALNILKHVELPEGTTAGSPILLHAQIEALRLAFADAKWYVADPDVTTVPIVELLSEAYGAERAKLIDLSKASVDVEKGSPFASSDTVSFQVVDAMGNACSFINSNYAGFGSGIIPKGCGFTLQNRGANFSLVDGHPNALAPGKRPYHTIIPGLALLNDSFFASFSVMGGFMQPQGHVQTLMNLIDYRMDPQAALDAPRFCIDAETEGLSPVFVEDGVGEEVVEALKAKGHEIRVMSDLTRVYSSCFAGRGQMIIRHPRTEVLWGGSDGRGDGLAIGY